MYVLGCPCSLVWVTSVGYGFSVPGAYCHLLPGLHSGPSHSLAPSVEAALADSKHGEASSMVLSADGRLAAPLWVPPNVHDSQDTPETHTNAL